MKCNLSTADRVVRCTAGLALIALGILLVKSWPGLLVAFIGAVLVFSGTIGFCHVYKVLHISTLRKR